MKIKIITVISLQELTSDMRIKIFVIHIEWIIVALKIFVSHIDFFIIDLYNWRILCLMLLITLFILLTLKLRLIHWTIA